MFVLGVGGVADGGEVFGIAWRTADVFRRTTTGGLEQEGKPLRRGVLEPFFELDHMVPAVAGVIEKQFELRHFVVCVQYAYEDGRLIGACARTQRGL